nr:DNA replication protein DnaD [Staphylococcus lugdunensis]
MDIFQLKTRPVVLRRELFDHYSELGMDEQDLVILIKLIYAAETSNKQPSIEAL